VLGSDFGNRGKLIFDWEILCQHARENNPFPRSDFEVDFVSLLPMISETARIPVIGDLFKLGPSEMLLR
jgi:hypothetical protein